MINLSLGYYGAPDPVLYNYLSLCATAQPAIHVFAAAGNLPQPHPAPICDNSASANLLTDKHLFYPACFSYFFSNVTSVTQLSSIVAPCKYQNYSNKYITLGIYDKANCCTVPVDYVKQGNEYYEGSSFATPIASGIKMSTIFKSASTAITNSVWESILKYDPSQSYIKEGTYLMYSPKQ